MIFNYRNKILVGDVRDTLALLPDESVHMVCTSPPYWGLRDYGTAVWGGGDAACDHLQTHREKRTFADGSGRGGNNNQSWSEREASGVFRDECGKCGATRIDAQLGLEATPELFVQNMVAVFREVRRVLRKDGTLWLNLGDCYNSGTSAKRQPNKNVHYGPHAEVGYWLNAGQMGDERVNVPDLKTKDLVGMPWRVAFALQADGWWLRSDIIWSKPNPMPESVTDRPTKSHEYLFLLSRSERYYYDIEAIREPLSAVSIARISQPNFANQTGGPKDYGPDSNRSMRKALENFAERVAGDRALGVKLTEAPDEVRASASARMGRGAGWRDDPDVATATGRNRRTVWEIPTQPYAEAHFATYPEALVLPCIQAGTSEHGVCSVCGAPWRRVVEREPLTDETKAAFEAGRQRNGDETGRSDGYAAYKPHQERAVLSTRWEPTCKHEAPLARALVLDPFMGSGTTGLVANRAGRDYVGIELNETYAAMAARRIGSQISLF